MILLLLSRYTKCVLLGVVMSKNVLFPTLEPALPKLPNTPSKGYLDNVRWVLVGSAIRFMSV